MNPEIRVAMVKDFLALLQDGKVPQGAEILAFAEPGFAKRVEESSRIDWLAAEPVVKLAEKARSLLGTDQWRSVHRAVAGDLVQRPLFRAFSLGMRTVFGATPAAYCKIFPLALKQAHRNYGSIEYVSIGKTAAQVRFSGCPTEALSRGMLDVFAGTLEGLVIPTARNVSVEVEFEPGADNAVISVHWDH